MYNMHSVHFWKQYTKYRLLRLVRKVTWCLSQIFYSSDTLKKKYNGDWFEIGHVTVRSKRYTIWRHKSVIGLTYKSRDLHVFKTNHHIFFSGYLTNKKGE